MSRQYVFLSHATKMNIDKLLFKHIEFPFDGRPSNDPLSPRDYGEPPLIS